MTQIGRSRSQKEIAHVVPAIFVLRLLSEFRLEARHLTAELIRSLRAAESTRTFKIEEEDVSRLLSRFVREGWVRKLPNARFEITEEGRREFETLYRANILKILANIRDFKPTFFELYASSGDLITDLVAVLYNLVFQLGLVQANEDFSLELTEAGQKKLHQSDLAEDNP